MVKKCEHMFIRFDMIHERKKIVVFTYRSPHFCFPWGRPWGNHGKYCMDGKRIRCLQIVSQHAPIYLQQFPSYSNRKCKKSPFSRTAAHILPRDVMQARSLLSCSVCLSVCLSVRPSRSWITSK